MKRTTASFTGSNPIFTGSPSLVPGGFNLDRSKQRLSTGDVIPGGTLAIFNEETRLVSVLKTAKVAKVDTTDAKKVSLYVDEFYSPIFSVGDSVLKADAISGNFSDAPKITAIEKTETKFEITLSAAITGLAAGDVLEEVVSDSESKAAEIGAANSAIPGEITVREYETPVDVTADTMQYAMYERRVPPIPASQKDTTGAFLKANVHVKLTKSN